MKKLYFYLPIIIFAFSCGRVEKKNCFLGDDGKWHFLWSKNLDNSSSNEAKKKLNNSKNNRSDTTIDQKNQSDDDNDQVDQKMKKFLNDLWIEEYLITKIVEEIKDEVLKVNIDDDIINDNCLDIDNYNSSCIYDMLSNVSCYSNNAEKLDSIFIKYFVMEKFKDACTKNSRRIKRFQSFYKEYKKLKESNQLPESFYFVISDLSSQSDQTYNYLVYCSDNSGISFKSLFSIILFQPERSKINKLINQKLKEKSGQLNNYQRIGEIFSAS